MTNIENYNKRIVTNLSVNQNTRHAINYFNISRNLIKQYKYKREEKQLYGQKTR